MISVITPCYRQAHLLSDAVESVLQQSYPNIELLVVNDGSDDNTSEVASKFGNRIRYLERPNGGLSAARNTGIEAARGTYLLFLDSDDSLHPDAAAWLAEAVAESENHVAVMGFRFFESSPHEPEPESRRDFLPDPGLSAFPDLIQKNFGPPHSFLSPRQMVVDVGGFKEDLRSCEDWDLWVRLALAGATFKAVPEIGAYYRRYEGSMSTNSRRMLQTRTKVLLSLDNEMVQRSDLLSQFGEELLDAERRVLRRLLVAGGEGELADTLMKSIWRLHSEGVVDTRSRLRLTIERGLGQLSEKMALLYLRLCDKEKYMRYSRGVN